jgi:hypothetical protein
MSTAKPTNAIAGLVLSIVGATIILIDAIAYLIGGNVLVGIIGALLSILILIFAFVAYFAKGVAALVSSMLVFLFGFIVMAAAGVLLVDFIAILAAFVAVVGGILLVPRKPASA